MIWDFWDLCTQMIGAVLYASTGIEASDLSSLLEQFEKSEGKETWVALLQPFFVDVSFGPSPVVA